MNALGNMLGAGRMVGRREIIGFSIAVFASPTALAALPLARIARVGVLESAPPSAFPDRLQGFRDGMSERGYTEGKSVVFDLRWSNGTVSDLPKLALDIIGRNPDVIVAGTTAAAVAAKRATSVIPIVFAVPADPVGAGLVASLAKPGGNITGLTTSNVGITPKRLELLKEISAGKISRIAVLFNPADASNVLAMTATEAAAKPQGLSVHAYPVDNPEGFDAAFSAMSRDGLQGLYVVAGALTDSHATTLANLAATYRLPAVYGARGFVDAGGLLSYAARFSDNYRRAAVYVDKILRGARPSDLPVESANVFELAVNIRTAKALNLDVPRSILLRTDSVIR